LEKVSDLVSVPAGEFEVLNYKGSVTTPENIPAIGNPRYLHSLYAKDVRR
jgi:hypothetical protein